MIFIPGNFWTGAHSWMNPQGGYSANADVMVHVTDPLNNYAYEVHQVCGINNNSNNTNSHGDDRNNEYPIHLLSL